MECTFCGRTVEEDGIIIGVDNDFETICEDCIDTWDEKPWDD